MSDQAKEASNHTKTFWGTWFFKLGFSVSGKVVVVTRLGMFSSVSQKFPFGFMSLSKVELILKKLCQQLTRVISACQTRVLIEKLTKI